MQEETPIRKRRKAAGMSLREVARRINIDASQLSKIELGEAKPTVQRLYDISVAIGNEELAKALEPYVDYTFSPLVLQMVNEARIAKEADLASGQQ